jgi:NACalpha-BTF3-like transcription factor
MSTTSRGRNQDRARVAAGQEHEVRYEAKKKGVSREDVKQAVKSVGNSRDKVETALEKKH